MDVFLSYNRRDAAQAAAINAWLGSQGVATFFDQRDLGGGQLFLPDLERRIEHDVQAVAVLVGPAGLGNTQHYEYQLALTRQAKEPDFPLIPVILPGTPDWRLPRGFLALQTWISFAGSDDPQQDPAALQRLLAAIRRQPTDADAIRGTICPYKGLGFFAEEDSAVFFGRDVEAASLHTTLAAHRVAALIGRSGAGKSSLVRAGLLPRLRRKAETGWGSVWDSLVIRPGAEPLVALAGALSPPRPEEDHLERYHRLRIQADALRDDQPALFADMLHHRLGEARLRVDRLLVVVDQAEELFAPPWHLADAAEIARFHADTEQLIRLLLAAAARGPASVVLTIRSDYFDPLMHSPFGPVLKDTLVQLGQIGDLRPCIERPAALVGLRFAPGLVDRIVAEVGPEESNLPLLQHALQRTWQQARGGVMSDEAYNASGGVEKAINQAAKDCYESLSPEARAAAKRLFLRLVRPGDGGSHVRIRATVPADADELRVMEAFAHPDRRLLFVGEQHGHPVVEVAHEALVRGWDVLRGWVEESRERLRVRDAVRDWRATAAPGELIPRGTTLLQRAADLLADPGDVRLDPDLLAYIERSLAAAAAAEAAEAASLAAEAAIVLQRRHRLLAAVTAVAVLFAGLAATSAWFWRDSVAQREVAVAQRTVADKQRAIAETQRAAAEQQRAEAEAQRKIAEQQRAMAETQRQQRASAETQRKRAESSAAVAQSAANGLIFRIAQGLRNQSGMSTETVRKFLDTPLNLLEQMLEASPNDPDVLRLKEVALNEFATTIGQAGDTKRQMEMLRQAGTIADQLAEMRPDDVLSQEDVWVSHMKMGDVLADQSNLNGALTSYRGGVAVVERLAAAAPTDARWQRDLSASYDRVGNVLVMQGVVDGALEAYRAALAIDENAVATAPDDTVSLQYLSVSHDKVGDVLVERGDLKGALVSYRSSQRIRERLTATDPGNAGWQRDLSVSHEKMGDVLAAQGDLKDALEAYRADLAISRRLAESDHANVVWQRDLSVSNDKIGDILVAQDDLKGALETFRVSLAIRQRLATADPGNTELQSDLSLSHEKIGDVLEAQADHKDALEEYHTRLAIIQALAGADPANAGRQRDLSVSQERIGDVLEAEGDHKGALEAYRACLIIRQGLATADPGNAGWQRDLSVNREKIGDVLAAQGDLNGALEAYRADLLIAQHLATADPDNAEWQRDLSISLARVADTLLRQNKPADALPLAQQALVQRRAAIARFQNDPHLAQALPYYETLVRRAGGTP